MFKYPWGNLQGLNLAWFLEKFNQLLEDWATAEAGIDGALDDEIQKAEDALSDVFDARDAAAASATAAAGSATQAGTSATAAQNSATAAASSATLANNKATAAGLSEANATQSASQAAGSATAAAGSATAAAGSATQAGQEATNAAGSATAAGNSATAAAGSATAAAASAERAEEVEQSIPEDYSALSAAVTGFYYKVEYDGTETLLSSYVSTDGIFNSSASWQNSGFLPLPMKNGGSIKIKCSLYGNGGLAFYDEKWNCLRYINGNNASEYGYSTGALAVERTVDVPKNTQFFAMSINITGSQTQVDMTAKCAINGLDQAIIFYSQKRCIAPTETYKNANRRYEKNELVFLGYQLYKTTTVIPDGNAFVIGTNIVETTIGELLTSLLPQ